MSLLTLSYPPKLHNTCSLSWYDHDDFNAVYWQQQFIIQHLWLIHDSEGLSKVYCPTLHCAEEATVQVVCKMYLAQPENGLLSPSRAARKRHSWLFWSFWRRDGRWPSFLSCSKGLWLCHHGHRENGELWSEVNYPVNYDSIIRFIWCLYFHYLEKKCLCIAEGKHQQQCQSFVIIHIWLMW